VGGGLSLLAVLRSFELVQNLVALMTPGRDSCSRTNPVASSRLRMMRPSMSRISGVK